MLKFIKNNVLNLHVPFYKVEKGDVINYGGKFYAFDRFPKGGKNWYGKSMENGKSYRIPMVDKFVVVGKYNFDEVVKPVLKDSGLTLKEGDLFVIKHGRGNNAELFRYVRDTEKNVIAVNPLNNKQYRISKSYTFTKIDNLPY